MITMSTTAFRKNLYNTIGRTNEDCAPVHITTTRGKGAVLTAEERQSFYRGDALPAEHPRYDRKHPRRPRGISRGGAPSRRRGVIGMWDIELGRQAVRDLKRVRSARLSEKAHRLIEALRHDQFITPPSFEPLWGNLACCYSRRINSSIASYTRRSEIRTSAMAGSMREPCAFSTCGFITRGWGGADSDRENRRVLHEQQPPQPTPPPRGPLGRWGSCAWSAPRRRRRAP